MMTHSLKKSQVRKSDPNRKFDPNRVMRWNQPPIPLEKSHEESMLTNYDVPGLVQARRVRGERMGPVENFTTEEWERKLGLKKGGLRSALKRRKAGSTGASR